MNTAVNRDVLETLAHISERASIDAVLAEDAWRTHAALRGCSAEAATALDSMSDLELACAYERGDVDLNDAFYCELHRRGLSPWKIQSMPAQEAP